MNMIKLTLGTPPQKQLDVESVHGENEQWRDLWQGSLRSENENNINALVSTLRPNCRNLLVIGIGGSSLGLKAIQNALLDPNWNLLPDDQRNGPRLFVIDNIDPVTTCSTFEVVKKDDPDLKHTVVCIISKSGETIEIAANLMVALKELSSATFIAITGKSGSLRDFAAENGWKTLLVPEEVGGRFSVLSPVGLFPAAMCGVDIGALLDGAREMAQSCSSTKNNVAASLATFLIGHAAENRTTQVMMPYCEGFTYLAHWWVQLWAESLGKTNENSVRVGPTPLVAIGATDQHSVLQLWREGPVDKVIGFIGVDQGIDVSLGEQAISKNIDWLCNKTMREVLHAEQEATTQAVSEAEQATWTLTFPEVSALTLGQFFALWELTTAIAGRLLKVNPYNQPGVELAKQLTADKLR
jgi:glucose-6-phosphate isomerase